jgi:15-cis-phytoene synthase
MPPLSLPIPAETPASQMSSAQADLAACRELLRNGSRTFLAASLLLPRAVHEPACALYAFCRLADDAVDEPTRQADAVARLRERLHLAYAGTPLPIAADRALAAVVARFAIPRELPEALLEGFEWDAAGRRYESFDEVCEYAARVAGAVGAMMALLMGARSAEAVARACDLGVAMQLSNIARDVGEDARMGRLYLPRQWLREAGIDPDAWLAQPVFSVELGRVVQRLLNAADGLYQGVDAGVALLPLACRPGINAARFMYADIGHEVQRRGLNSVDQRAVVSPTRKLQLVLRSLLVLQPARARSALPPSACTRYLVDAASSAALPRQVSMPWWNIKQRAIWTLELFERLERRDRLPMRGTAGVT